MNKHSVSPKIYDHERLTRRQKEYDNYQYYREKIDSYDTEGNTVKSGYGGVSEYKRMKVNYDLFNNIIDLSDFAYVCQPFGAEAGELPAMMVNRDISSYRIKALLGMEMRRPFAYKCMAVNKEATTRKEAEESSRISQYVIAEIMRPIQEQIELKYQQEQAGGRQLTPQELEQLKARIAEETAAQTPPEVKRYMQRDHQDPSEVQGQQILNYLMKEQDIKKKFSNGWKHATLSAYELYWVGIVNGKPVGKVINPLRFNCDKSPDLDYIEDGEWATAEFRMHPSEVVKMFELTDKEIDEVYNNYQHYVTDSIRENMFESSEDYEKDEDINTIKVIHSVWKGLRKIGWLDYIDPDGELQTKFMVDEDYRLNKENGDISLTWEWIPEVYEGYKIGSNIYKNMQPVAGQFKDMDTLYECKLPYIGAIYDNMNSQPTSIMDRMKVYQYYYNIVMYRLELLLASDDGKKILMNINAIPESAGIDIEKWQYFFKSTPFMWYNPDEEGMTGQDVNTIAKTLDMSMASDIGKYIDLAEYLEQKCGKSVGVTDPVLGQTAVSERVGNNQQNLVQTAHMLEPYFDLHNSVKKNFLQALLNTAKVAYVESELESLSYFMDDMSQEIINLDINLLSNTTLGLFIEDSSAAEEVKQTVRTLAHAAMQNQKIELSDVLSVIKHDNSIQEAEETLIAAESRRMEREQSNEKANRQFQADEAQKERDEKALDHDREIEKIITKERERRKTEIQKQTILSVGFNENKDFDGDGELDAMEIARDGVAARIALSKEAREDRLADHKIKDDEEKNKIAKMQKQSTSK